MRIPNKLITDKLKEYNLKLGHSPYKCARFTGKVNIGHIYGVKGAKGWQILQIINDSGGVVAIFGKKRLSGIEVLRLLEKETTKL